MMKRGCGRPKSTVQPSPASHPPLKNQPVEITTMKKGARAHDDVVSKDKEGSEEEMLTESETLIVTNSGSKSVNEEQVERKLWVDVLSDNRNL